jgi:cyclopropane fatty-acyl-phospholipid synthase-like methyltransferase
MSVPAGYFEERYRAEVDPWSYRSSGYEREKYAATLRACGTGPFARALELGASIGEFSALLAPRVRGLDTIDFAPTAVAHARRRVRDLPHVHPQVGKVPDDLPDGPFDLVIASEILYYLDDRDLERTLGEVRRRMTVGARLVAVHHRPDGPERPLSADAVHAALRRPGWKAIATRATALYRLDVVTASPAGD